MASVEQAILDRVETLLGTGSGMPVGLTTHRFRSRPVTAGTDLPIAVVYPVKGPPPERADLEGMVLETLQVRVTLICSGPGDRPDLDATPPDTALDPLYVWARTRIMAAGAFDAQGVDDVRLGGSEWDDAEDVEAVYAQRVIDFEFDYYTDETDPETIA